MYGYIGEVVAIFWTINDPPGHHGLKKTLSCMEKDTTDLEILNITSQLTFPKYGEFGAVYRRNSGKM